MPTRTALAVGTRRINNQRAQRALRILRIYERDYDPGEGVEIALIDLLADLMHWGSRKRRHSSTDKFEAALEGARIHFAAEQAGAL